MKDAKVIVVVAVLLLAITGGGFYAGMRYQQSKSPRFGNFQGNRNGQFQQRLGQGARPVRGEIINQDEKSITVKLPVLVLGKENSDGSVTAQNIQLNPTARGMFNQGSGGQ